MNEFQHIKTEVRGDIVYISLNCPEKGNAINMDATRELIRAFNNYETEKSIRFVVLKGEGKNFCTGADLNWMAKSVDLDYEENFNESYILADLFYIIYKSKKIVISAVQGACIGGGVGLAAVSDFVLVSAEAWFAFSEVKLGLVPATISPYIVYRMGLHHAKRLMLTGEKISAEAALRYNLADELCPSGKLNELLNDLLQRLHEGGKSAQQTIKNLVREIIPLSLIDQIKRKTSGIIAESRVSEEGQEGIKAFLEKRNPNWKQN